jgi:hypothetical protein
MSIRVQALTQAAEGRYLTQDERKALRDYAASVPSRLNAAESIEAAESDVLNRVVDEMRKRHPNFATHREQPWARLFRDVQLVLRTCTHAVVCDDVRLLDERVLYWLRSVAAAAGVPTSFQNDCYSLLRDVCASKLSSSDFAMLKPMLDRAAAVLGSDELQS